MMGSVEARSSKLTARADSHRDRNGLTFPTSSPEQIATPERSSTRVHGRLTETEVRASHPHAVHDDSQLSSYRHARFLHTYMFASFTPQARRTDHFFAILRCEFAAS